MDSWIERLICLVEERPVLWDKRLNEYSDRDEKAKAWVDINRNIIAGWNDLSKEDQEKRGEY